MTIEASCHHDAVIELKRLMPNGGRASIRFLAAWSIDDDAELCESIARSLEKNPSATTLFSMRVETARAWAHSGMQSVTMPPAYAAALMATDVSTEVAHHCRPPWPAFEVIVPDGLMRTEQYGAVQAAYFSKLPGGTMVVTMATDRGAVSATFNGIEELVANSSFERLSNERVDDESYEQMMRALFMCRRLLLNVSIDISTTPPRLLGKRPVDKWKRDGRGVFVPTTYAIGRPLTIDCRDAIRDYVSGSSAATPRVTTLVRGHRRMQPHGPQGSLRKQIWIQPFYRGEGPMLVRTTRLGYGAHEVPEERRVP